MATYVGMSFTNEAREDFRQLVYTLAPRVGRRVEMSEVLSAITAYATEHIDDIAAALTEEK